MSILERNNGLALCVDGAMAIGEAIAVWIGLAPTVSEAIVAHQHVYDTRNNSNPSSVVQPTAPPTVSLEEGPSEEDPQSIHLGLRLGADTAPLLGFAYIGGDA